MTLSLSPGQAHDAPEGRRLLYRLELGPEGLLLLMDGHTRETKPGNRR